MRKGLILAFACGALLLAAPLAQAGIVQEIVAFKNELSYVAGLIDGLQSDPDIQADAEATAILNECEELNNRMIVLGEALLDEFV